jgi:transposase
VRTASRAELRRCAGGDFLRQGWPVSVEPEPAGAWPRLCQSYRPRTKGKVERFIRYLRASFYVPLASQLSPEGIKVANARVGTWLREVANARVHATTGEIPLVRLEQGA